MSSRIHLGLDLRGGAHLILQVVVSEAVSAETDNTVARDPAGPEDGQPDLLAGVQAGSATSRKSFAVEGIRQSSRAHAFARCWTPSIPTNTTWPAAARTPAFTLTMKPLVEKALEEKTVQQAIETIRDRVDSLGVSEPKIAAVQPGRQPDSGGTARHQRSGSGQEPSFSRRRGLRFTLWWADLIQDEAAALASVGGALPADQEMVHGSGSAGNRLRR